MRRWSTSSLIARKSVLNKLKLSLPLGALLVLGVFFFWPQGNSRIPFFSPPPSPPSSVVSNIVTHPQFDTVDHQGRPFQIRADEGKEEQDGKVRLEKPSVLMASPDKGQMDAKSLEGFWDRNSKELRLEKDVRFQHSSGLTLQTSSVVVDLATGSARSDAPLTGDGPLGHLEAKRFRYQGEGKILTLLDRPTLVLNLSHRSRP